MITPLHTLLVAEAPAQPVLDGIRRAGYDPRPHYVQTPEAFGAALMQRSWDVVVARYGLPTLSVWDALASLQRQHMQTPLIVVADGLNEQRVVELIQAGVSDILRTTELGRIGVAVAKAQQRKPLTSDGDEHTVDTAFQGLAEHMPIGLYRSTHDGRILYANPALARILGRESVDELLGGDVFSTLSYPRESFVEQIDADGAVHNLEASWHRPSGERIWTRENTRAVRDEAGDLLYYEGTMEDITEEREALATEHHRVEQLEAIVRFSAAVDAAQSSEALHRAVVEAVEETLGADAAVLVQREDGQYEIRAWSDAISEESVRRCSEAEVWSSYPAHTQPLLLRDERLADESAFSGELREFMREAGLRALGSFPLLYRGHPLGMVVTFFREPHTFTEGELRIAETLAWHVAVALSRWDTEVSLRHSEASLRTVADTTGHVLYRRRTGADAYDYVTPSIQKLTGYTEDELEASGGIEALIETGETVAGAPLLEGQIDSEDESFSAHYQIRTKDGQSRWIEDCAYPWIDEAGETVGLVGVLQDVTARRERERTERDRSLRSLSQQRAITELSTAQSAPEDLLDRVTEVAARTLGASRVGLWVMHGGPDGMHHEDRYVLADDAHESETRFPLEAVLAETDQEGARDTLVFDAIGASSSGEHAALAAYCEREGVGALILAPIRKQGSGLGFIAFEQVGAARDWTVDEQEFAEDVAAAVSLLIEHLHRARAESALRSSELRYRAISELAADYAYSLRLADDGQTRFEWATKAFERISGYTPEEVGDVHSLLDLVHEEDRGFVKAEFRRLEAGHTIALEVRIRTKRGDIRWVSNRSRPVLDVDGRVLQIYSSGTDITERKAFEAELIDAREQAEEMVRLKSAFLANMSHEIRTPLTGILGFAGVLAEEVEDEQREFADLIAKSGHRLLDTLNSVLDLAQLESDALRVAASPLDVQDEARQVIRLLEPLAEEKGIALSFASEGDIIAPLDPTCLNRILHNLVGNAIKFTEEGIVRVTVRPDRDRVEIAVSDTGIGIDEEFIPHLFDEFKQESMGQGRSHEGSGLGLAITRKLVQLMGGTIEVESRKGEGSTFTISFPRIEPVEPLTSVSGDGQAEAFGEPHVDLGAEDELPAETEPSPDEFDPARGDELLSESASSIPAESDSGDTWIDASVPLAPTNLPEAETIPETLEEAASHDDEMLGGLEHEESVESEIEPYVLHDALNLSEPRQGLASPMKDERPGLSVPSEIDSMSPDETILSHDPSFDQTGSEWEEADAPPQDEKPSESTAEYEDSEGSVEAEPLDEPLQLEMEVDEEDMAEAETQAEAEPPEAIESHEHEDVGTLPEASKAEEKKVAVLVVEDNDETRLLIERVLRGAYEVDAVADARTALQHMNERSYEALVLDINLGGKQTGVDILRVARAIPGYESITAVALTAYALPGDSERFLDAGFDRYVSKPFTKRGLLDALAAGSRTEAARS